MIVAILLVLSAIACSQRTPKVVQIGPNQLGYILLTDRPVSSDPNIDPDEDFDYVGQVQDGTRCAVQAALIVHGESILKVLCDGLNTPGYVPADAVTPVEY